MYRWMDHEYEPSPEIDGKKNHGRISDLVHSWRALDPLHTFRRQRKRKSRWSYLSDQIRPRDNRRKIKWMMKIVYMIKITCTCTYRHTPIRLIILLITSTGHPQHPNWVEISDPPCATMWGSRSTVDSPSWHPLNLIHAYHGKVEDPDPDSS